MLLVLLQHLLSTRLYLKKLEQNITHSHIFPLGIVAISFILIGADKVPDLINVVGNAAVDDLKIGEGGDVSVCEADDRGALEWVQRLGRACHGRGTLTEGPVEGNAADWTFGGCRSIDSRRGRGEGRGWSRGRCWRGGHCDLI